MNVNKTSITYEALWKKSSSRPTPTANENLDLILGSVTHLPLRYWKKNFFFKGGVNSSLREMTLGRFPAKADPRGTHPVFAIRQVANGAGFEVCPCSSSPRQRQKWIQKGTRLLYTGNTMDKTTYLVEQIRFNMPLTESIKLRFMGEVAPHDIHSTQKGELHGNG